MARSGYVPLVGKVDDRERQEVVRIRSAGEECEDTSTEALQYYEYGENTSTRRKTCRVLFSVISRPLLPSLLFNGHKQDPRLLDARPE